MVQDTSNWDSLNLLFLFNQSFPHHSLDKLSQEYVSQCHIVLESGDIQAPQTSDADPLGLVQTLKVLPSLALPFFTAALSQSG